ncbi:MAG TPA: hypothetical protein VGO97_01045 [Solirubrobacterales bacterium]|jgi:DNA-binding response OmpR family regulator|nr:hypothetical protein [Solirubrobacterales bacterium]
MADQPRVVCLLDDLLFGSKVEAMVAGAGATAVTFAEPDAATTAMSDGASLVIVDLTSERFDGISVPRPDGLPTLGFYAHTDDETRRRALDAGFDLVVPRSRMMREGVELIASLITAG